MRARGCADPRFEKGEGEFRVRRVRGPALESEAPHYRRGVRDLQRSKRRRRRLPAQESAVPVFWRCFSCLREDGGLPIPHC